MSTNTNYENEKIYKIKADGSEQKIQLSLNRAFCTIVAGEWIHYTTEEEDSYYIVGGQFTK